jgi:hypothetical protein
MAEAASEAAARVGTPGQGAGNPAGLGAENAGGPGAGNGGEPLKPPPAGWQIPEDPRAAIPDIDPFVVLIQAVRELIPPELQRRLVAALRELLLALRALIDWYLERIERKREQSVEVEDIPIM